VAKSNTITRLADAQTAFKARWPSVGEWWPDATQRGFPAALYRLGSTDTLVAPVGTTFANSIRHRAITRTTGTATAAAIIREADGSGANANASCSTVAGFEIFTVIRFDDVAAEQWSLAGAFLDAGSFPFADLWGTTGVVGVGFTTIGTDTPITDLEFVTTNGTAGANRTRTSLGAVRATDSWLAINVRVYGAHEPGGTRATCKVTNLATGLEASAEHTTTLPAGMLHATVMQSNGVTPAGAANFSIAYFGRGTI